MKNSYYGDNVPPDVPGPKEELVTHCCPTCGHVWDALMCYELGQWVYFDDDNEICAICGDLGEA